MLPPQCARRTHLGRSWCATACQRARTKPWQLNWTQHNFDGRADPCRAQAAVQVTPIVSSVMLLSAISRINFAAIAPMLADSLSLTALQLSYVHSAFLVGYFAGHIPAGMLADRVGGMRVLALGSLACSAVTLLHAALPITARGGSLAGLLVLRFLVGATTASAVPALSATMAQMLPPLKRSRATSFSYGGFNFGTVVGLIVTPLLTTWLGWRGTFAAIAVVSGAWSLLMLRQAPTLSNVVAKSIDSYGGTATDSIRAANSLASKISSPPDRPGNGASRAAYSQASSSKTSVSKQIAESNGSKVTSSSRKSAVKSALTVSTNADCSTTTRSSSSSSSRTKISSGDSSRSKGESNSNTSSATSSTPGLGYMRARIAADVADLPGDVKASHEVSSQVRERSGARFTPDHPEAPLCRKQMFGLIWAHSVIGWGFFTFQNWIPTYLSQMQAASPMMCGVLAAAPWAASTVLSFWFGAFFPWLRKVSGMDTHGVQTVAHAIASIGAAAALLPLALGLATTPLHALLCIGAALALQTCNYSGFHAYVQVHGAGRAGSILGVTNSCGILTGLAANLITGFLVTANGSYTAVFVATAVIYASSFVVWKLLLKGELLYA